MRLDGFHVDGPDGPFSGADRATLYARPVLPPIENRDPGDETTEDED
jgi:hypothetical protein